MRRIFSTSMRLTAAISAGLLFCANGAAALHLATTEHRVCPEHGELLHVVGASNATAPGSDLAALDGGSGRLDHDSATCPLSVLMPQAASAVAQLEAPSTPDARTVASAAAAVPESADLLHLAPKTSPPA